MTKRLQLNPDLFNPTNVKDSLSKASRRADLSYPTVLAYINSPGDPEAQKRVLDLRVLLAILTDVLQIPEGELLEMRIGDVFVIAEEAEPIAQP